MSTASSVLDRFTRLLSHKRKETAFDLWQDREIRFDLTAAQIRPCNGESVVASLAPRIEWSCPKGDVCVQENVEDTKGRRYEVGCLYVTNLRTIWASLKRKRCNMSIGHRCVDDVQFEEVLARLQGELSVIHVLTRYGDSVFQFVFSSYEGDARDVYEVLRTAVETYRKTRLYRDLAIRDLLLREKELLLLKQEEVVERVEPVHNLLCDEAHRGVMFVTNVRMVWSSVEAQDLNVSIPYVQMRSVKVRDSKFGKALVVETSQRSGGYVLGFRLEPENEMQRVQKEIASIREAFLQNPTFGVEDHTLAPPQLRHDAIPTDGQDTDGDEDVAETKGDVLAMYCTTEGDAADRPPVFNATLGLAIEALRDGVSIEDLWNVT